MLTLELYIVMAQRKAFKTVYWTRLNGIEVHVFWKNISVYVHTSHTEQVDLCTLQICQHTGPVIDPDHRDAEPAPASTAAVAKLIKTTFNFVSTTPSIYESCMYTVSGALAVPLWGNRNDAVRKSISRRS